MLSLSLKQREQLGEILGGEEIPGAQRQPRFQLSALAWGSSVEYRQSKISKADKTACYLFIAVYSRPLLLFKGDTINISEFEATVGNQGELVIPMKIIAQMGLGPSDNVYISYITDDGFRNRFREFMLSPYPFDETEQPTYLSVPTALLAEANIPEDTEIEIICLDGAVILCREKALSSEDMRQILQSMDIALDLSFCVPDDPEAAQEYLQQHINNVEDELYEDNRE